MSSDWGRRLHISIFGESHGEAIGVVIDSPMPGEEISIPLLQSFLARRAPSGGSFSTKRREPDRAEIVSGLYNGRTTGTPLTVIIKNTDQRSGDYKPFSDIPRPSHADHTGAVRYGGYSDPRGGGHFSGRLTAPLVAAGGIALQIVKRRGIDIGAHLKSIGSVSDMSFDELSLDSATITGLHELPFPALSGEIGEQMLGEIAAAAAEGDSLGGVIECGIAGLPEGLGSPMFWGVENAISSVVFGIPAVRGIEFGAGFEAARQKGSEHNDLYFMDGDRVSTRTNRHGGVLGGITSGMPVIFRVAMKPTASISKEQETLNIKTGRTDTLRVAGRHDPCLAVRAVPCVEAAAALAILEFLV